MNKHTVYAGLDPCLAENGETLFRLCLLLSRRSDAADSLAFEALLRLAVREEGDPASDRVFLLKEACRLCRDWFYRKSRRLKAAIVQQDMEALGLSEAWPKLCRLSFSSRAACALRASGYTPEEIRGIAGAGAARKASALSAGQIACAASVHLPEDRLQLLSDRVWQRMEERSVSVENRLHDFHAAFERAAPFLALGVLLLFGLSLWLTR